MTGALRSLGGLTRLAALFLLIGILAATALARDLPETEAPPPEDDGGGGDARMGCSPSSPCPSSIRCGRFELSWCCPRQGSMVCKCFVPGDEPSGCIPPGP